MKINARETSILAFQAIKDNGLLSERRFQVYQIIFEHGPVNCRQIIEIASRGNVTNTGAFSGRLSELERLGVIESHSVGPCPITGHETIFWVTTDQMPAKFEKEIKTKCPHCDGKGYRVEQQVRMRI